MSMSSYADIVGRLRASFDAGKTRSLEFRLAQIQSLGKLLEENKAAINEALLQDLNKPAFETELSEISLVNTDVNLALNNLKTWMKDEYVEKNWATTFDSAFIRKDPFGVVLIIGAWNYPVNLLLIPLVGAIAAGNCAILKPSELSKSTEKLLSDLLPRYLDQECFAVVCGGPQDTTQLLENKFDYIFFTGSPNVGKIIMTAAAKQLTPVTLELGGKNPCFVDDGCDFKSTANRLAWSRFYNAGQTCVAPDYVLCTQEMREKLVPALKETLEEFYGKDPQQSPDFGRIVNDRHFQRVKALLGSGTVAIGGQSDEKTKYIAPTVLVDVTESDPVMQEEIFGPVLPIFTVKSLDEAIAFINRHERPLAIYAFSPDGKVVDAVLARTSSGGFCGNDGMMHMSVPTLPFGGIGNSGMGVYHGKFSYDTFSHHRGVLLRSTGMEKLNTLRYPPYAQRNIGWLISATETKRKGMCNIL
ncbi:aldehyde dehydrogenase family 3 member B1 isoform X2 [Ambystoma mexicanum]|uniref:aldehyde dehydrogenase family 3 member B1 isoform X2 n=1 Tax=Ambystoma mexicanum TaxID=8296 RepID=UPI0037E99516